MFWNYFWSTRCFLKVTLEKNPEKKALVSVHAKTCLYDGRSVTNYFGRIFNRSVTVMRVALYSATRTLNGNCVIFLMKYQLPGKSTFLVTGR